MIVPVIEHMEKKMNSTSTITTTTTTTTARLLNSSDDKSTCLIVNETKAHLENCTLDHNEKLSSSSISSSSESKKRNENENNFSDEDEEKNLKKLRPDSFRINENAQTLKIDTNNNDVNNNLKISKANDENKIDVNQQTIIIEGGINTLQFQLKPEIIPNRQITLKLVPVSSSSPNDANLLNDASQILKTASNLENIQQNLILSESNSENLASNDYKNAKNNKQNSGSIQTVKLTESNPNVYFMMQPIDLLSNSLQSNSVKIKSPSNTVSSTSQSHNNSNNLSTITLQNVSHSTGFNSNSLSSNTTTVTLGSPVSSTTSTNGTPKVVRDERRRANHNEVERRRRDNINKWIVELSKVIPDCCNDQSKHGQSKGGILEKTVQYLLDMKKQNQNLCDQLRNLENLKPENEFLKQQLEDYKKENQMLKMKLGLDNSDGHF